MNHENFLEVIELLKNIQLPIKKILQPLIQLKLYENSYQIKYTATRVYVHVVVDSPYVNLVRDFLFYIILQLLLVTEGEEPHIHIIGQGKAELTFLEVGFICKKVKYKQLLTISSQSIIITVQFITALTDASHDHNWTLIDISDVYN